MTPTYPLDALARLAVAAGYNARGTVTDRLSDRQG